MVRLVLSIIGGIAAMICVVVYSFTAMSTEEEVNGTKVSRWWDHWHQLHYKEIFDSQDDTKEWTLGTKYGVIHLSESKKDAGTSHKDSEAWDAVNEAGDSESLFYLLLGYWAVVTSVLLINHRRFTKKNPYLVKILLCFLPIFLIGLMIGIVQDAARASERAEKVFLELEK
ncbi:hypothetical protein [Fictibacillus fluitans]|uniref:DUF4306 domain-containing protein n=1 Tax=Fictibacillus fluitans TaxID=3058422 RepID=A0ABT8HUK0_9BACL|nr:hypothetical protein [Fictibacillus sp. NE201]MDN4524165.1 hypothetical protein [Fictibacillus sp. NE201]